MARLLSSSGSHVSERAGGHRSWNSDVSPFQVDFPEWTLSFTLELPARRIYQRNLARRSALS